MQSLNYWSLQIYQQLTSQTKQVTVLSSVAVWEASAT